MENSLHWNTHFILFLFSFCSISINFLGKTRTYTGRNFNSIVKWIIFHMHWSEIIQMTSCFNGWIIHLQGTLNHSLLMCSYTTSKRNFCFQNEEGKNKWVFFEAINIFFREYCFWIIQSFLKIFTSTEVSSYSPLQLFSF